MNRHLTLTATISGKSFTGQLFTATETAAFCLVGSLTANLGTGFAIGSAVSSQTPVQASSFTPT
ncbi:MAG: hypothetical protein NTV80_18770 [Verrucomicrobia bacterium]|nr:hypothetical protein [Verrucomicrobiota bacterium]